MALDKAHALLLQGAAGDGLHEAAAMIATAWLCEAAESQAARPCGACSACAAVSAHRHPDLRWLLPESLARELDPSGSTQDAADDGDGKVRRKPSRQIRIDDVREAIDWVSTSSSRGRGKVVLIFPAEAMNPQSANALLKTLEEPPPGARLLLATGQPALLLPTVRSRCQVLRLPTPTPEQSLAWLTDQGMVRPEVLLAAASGRPLDAAALAAVGIDADRWLALPEAVRRQRSAAFAGWPLPRVLDALLKLCHDAMASAAGARPRFFTTTDGAGRAALPALAAWSRELARVARHADHPFNEGLAVEQLLQQAASALSGQSLRSDTLDS